MQQEQTTSTPASRNLYQRLLAVTSEIGAVAKSGQARPGAGGYAYHKADDIEEALRPALVKHGVVTLVSLESYEGTETLVPKSDGENRVLHSGQAIVAITFVNADHPEETATVRACGEGLDFSDKAPGKAMTYAIKSAYLNTFHLKGQPDAEADDHNRQNGRRQSSGAAAREGSGSQQASNGSPSRLSFGKHKGKEISEVPADYLEWLVENARSEGIKKAARAELARRLDATGARQHAPEDDIPNDDDIPF